jgi:hypothetical protein
MCLYIRLYLENGIKQLVPNLARLFTDITKTFLRSQTTEEFLSLSPGEGGSYSSELRTQKNEAKNKAVFFDNIREGSKPRKICSGFESR